MFPIDPLSVARRCGYRNAFPVLDDARVWWPSRAMTKADYQRIDRHLRRYERRSIDTFCLSHVSAALLGLDSDDPCADTDITSAFYDVEMVRARLSGHVPLEILDVIGTAT